MVAVVAFVVAAAGGKVNGAGNFLVEQNIAHRNVHVGVNAYSELADVTRALIGIENLVDLLGVIGSSLDDLAVIEHEPHVFVLKPLLHRRSVVGNNAVYAVFYGCGINLAVGNVALARTL